MSDSALRVARHTRACLSVESAAPAASTFKRAASAKSPSRETGGAELHRAFHPTSFETDLLCQRARRLVRLANVFPAARLHVNQGDVDQRPRFGRPVAGLARHRAGAAHVVEGRLVERNERAHGPEAGIAEAALGPRLARPLGQVGVAQGGERNGVWN